MKFDIDEIFKKIASGDITTVEDVLATQTPVNQAVSRTSIKSLDILPLPIQGTITSRVRLSGITLNQYCKNLIDEGLSKEDIFSRLIIIYTSKGKTQSYATTKANIIYSTTKKEFQL